MICKGFFLFGVRMWVRIGKLWGQNVGLNVIAFSYDSLDFIRIVGRFNSINVNYITMRKEKFLLSRENKVLLIPVNPEDPYIRIRNNSSKLDPIEAESSCEALVILKTIRKNNRDELLEFHYSNGKGLKNLHDIPDFNEADIASIRIELESSTCANIEIGFEVQIGSDLIDLSNPITEFNDHISNPSNTKILFSAPFGQGKTTFLDFFFNLPSNRYEVFKVFPVNYAVASNEDIFRYIKTDVLFQLLSRDLSLDKRDVSWLKTAQEFIYLHPVKTIANFIKMTMSLDKRTAVINKVVSAFEPIVKEMSAYHVSQQVNEEEKATEYIKEVYEREGSIFEDNFYTQLIRQLLEQLRNSVGKQTILIIEDLDRMDPDHIFRILNVISAHYDTYTFGLNSDDNNKFGFDKIILVCDEENIRNIFHHKYGERTDFNGYFNKYFSSKPFYYKNHGAIGQFLRQLYFEDSDSQKRSSFTKAHNVVLEALVMSNLLSMRELMKLLKYDFDKFRFPSNHKFYYFQQGLFHKSIAFLDELFGKQLEYKLKQLSEISFDTGRKFDYYTKCLIAGLAGKKGKEFEYHGEVFDIGVTTEMREDYTIITEISGSNKSSFESFTHVDFYELLYRTYREFRQIKTDKSI